MTAMMHPSKTVSAMSDAPVGGVRTVTITPDDVGQRIDNYLLRVLKGLPRPRLYRLLRKGEIRVNSGRVRPEYRLQGGDRLRLPPIAGLNDAPSAERVPARVLDGLTQRILHEDERLLVIDKPAGVAVHAGSGIRYGLIEALRCLRPGPLELVHRLDRETSGCLLIAKRRSTLRQLHEELRAGHVEKRYLALLAGRLPRGTTPLEARLDVDHRDGGERIVRVSAAGKEARSLFRRLEPLPGGWALAEVRIETGRTHQIRVHAAHAGWPVLGDLRYGSAAANATARGFGLRRMFLHASTLRLPALEGVPAARFEAPLPQDLMDLLAGLRGTGMSQGEQ